MIDTTQPSDIARETLRQLALRRIAPTPDNYRALYHEIAEALNLSVKTVSVYRARLLEKMNLRNNAELTHYGLKHGLAE